MGKIYQGIEELVGQFTNPSNPDAHYRSTGPEIWEDTDGKGFYKWRRIISVIRLM